MNIFKGKPMGNTAMAWHNPIDPEIVGLPPQQTQTEE
jgi:hypothetical protein